MNQVMNQDLTGHAYDLPAPTWRRELTDVGRGTPMGELMRRYWHPVGVTADAGDTPRALRVLGEDLVLFRDRQGRPGLLHARCAHRGTTLYYGRVEDEGIRCCYHGWLFSVDGRCLDQPCEPGGGANRTKLRQPWYPVRERYGLIWAYMGPPARMPALPRYEPLENLAEGEMLETDDRSIGSGGAVIAPCNWLQHWENVVDPLHVPVLHGWFSGTQFVKEMLILPQVEFGYTERGVKVTTTRTLEDGRVFRRVTEACIPTLRVVPNPRLGRFERVESIGFVLPIDDTHYRIYTVGRVRQRGELQGFRSRLGGKLWEQMTEEEHQRFPGDLEAQVGQGAITAHSEEHLTGSDRGIGMLRRFLARQLEVMAGGGDPAGLVFDEDHAPIAFEAGNYPPQPAA
ncbi:MAG TPA: aromatic ring-hydroxylating dioxygenase subunit alpha [Burkholderiaceae bacterium]|nr:aromatic ring-hydroxylating dioxygenase subunit alpha [Burkholderiaceae bacterium]